MLAALHLGTKQGRVLAVHATLGRAFRNWPPSGHWEAKAAIRWPCRLMLRPYLLLVLQKGCVLARNLTRQQKTDPL
jgi:hypothetical protein